MDPDDSSARKAREPLDNVISVRFRNTEFEMLRQLSELDGVSMANWMRRVVIRIFKQKTRRPTAESRQEMLKQAAESALNPSREPHDSE